MAAVHGVEEHDDRYRQRCDQAEETCEQEPSLAWMLVSGGEQDDQDAAEDPNHADVTGRRGGSREGTCREQDPQISAGGVP